MTAVALGADSSRVISSAYDGAVASFDIASGEVQLLGYHRHLVNRVVLSPDARLAATCSSDYTVGLWDLESNQPLRQLLGHYDDVEDFVFIDDELGASASRDRRIIVWELATGSIVRILEGHERDVLALAGYSGRLYSSGDDMTLRVWELSTGRLLSTWGPFETETDTCALAPEHGRAFLGCDDAQLRVFDVDSGELIAELPGHRSGIKKVAVSPRTGDVLSAAYDQRVLVWDTESLTPKLELPSTRGVWERSLTWSADGRRILAGTFDGKVVSLMADTGELEVEVGADSTGPGNACFNDIGSGPSGVVVAASDDGIIRLGQDFGDHSGWLTTVLPPGERVLMNAAQLSPDAGHAALGTHDGRVLVFDLSGPTPELCGSKQLGSGPINTLGFRALPDDPWELYAGTYSGAIVVLDVASAVRRRIELHDGAVKSLVLVADRDLGVSCGADGLLLSWSNEGKLEQRFIGHEGIINDIDVDPSGRRLASVSRDFSLKIWDMDSGRLLFTRSLGKRSLKSVCFWNDSEVVVGDYWGGLHIVDIESGRCRVQQIVRNGISALARSRRGLAAASYAGEIVFFDPDGFLDRHRLVAMQQRLDDPSESWELTAVNREERPHA